MTITNNLKQIPKDSDFVILDLETTGFSREHDRIVEIAAIRVHDGVITERFHQRVNPEREIPEKVSAIHGIFDKDVADCPTIAEVMPEFLAFLGKAVLVAHNASFDVGFIRANVLRIGGSLPFYLVLDTLKLCKDYFPGLPSYSQINLAKHFGIEVKKAHSADDDCLVCHELLKWIFAERNRTIYWKCPTCGQLVTDLEYKAVMFCPVCKCKSSWAKFRIIIPLLNGVIV